MDQTRVSGRLIKVKPGTLTSEGATIYADGTLVSSGALLANRVGTISGSGSLTLTQAGPLELVGQPAGSGNVVMLGSGTLLLHDSPAAISSGTVSLINRGNLVLDNAPGQLIASGGLATGGDGSTLTTVSLGTVTLTGPNIRSGGAFLLNGTDSAAMTINGSIDIVGPGGSRYFPTSLNGWTGATAAGGNTTVPEPGTFVLLAVAGLFGLVRLAARWASVLRKGRLP
jgi:hypothetical protein